MRRVEIKIITSAIIFFMLGIQFGVSVSGTLATENKRLKIEIESLLENIKKKDETLDYFMKTMYESSVEDSKRNELSKF